MGSQPDAFHYSLALTDVRLSSGGAQLSSDAARLLAFLIMPDPRVQSSTEFEIEMEKFLRDYDNPRGLQKNWLERYLGRPRPQLAIDVIRAFDEHWKQKRSTSIKLWVLGGLVAAQFALILMLGQVVLERITK